MNRARFARTAMAAAVACVALGTASRTQATITVLADDFTGGSSVLNGRTTTVGGATWVDASTAPFGTVSGGTLTASGQNNKALLPFIPQSGKVYTLSATLSTTAGWTSLGFQSGADEGAPWNGYTYDWGRLAPTQAYAYGGNYTANSMGSTTVSAASHTISLTLDTTNTQWVASAKVDGTAFGTPYTYTTNPTIDHLWVGRADNTTGNIQNLMLTVPDDPTAMWAQTAAGTYAWNTSANWTGTGTFPNATGAVAGLNVDLQGNQTINLNQAITVGTLNVGDTAGSPGNTLLIGSGTGTNVLTFQSATAGGATTLNHTTTATGYPLIVTAGMKLGGTSPLAVKLNGATAYQATFNSLDVNGNTFTVKTGTNGTICNLGTVTGNGSIVLNSAGDTPAASDSGGITLTQAQSMTNYTGSIKVNNGRFWFVTQSLPSVSSISVGGAWILGDKYPKGGKIDIGNDSVQLSTLPDRLPHNGTLILNSGGYFYDRGAALAPALAGQAIVEQVKTIQFNPGMSEIKLRNGDGSESSLTLLANDPTNALVRAQGATLMAGGDDGGYRGQNLGVNEYLKFNSGMTAQLKGGGGAPGSQNQSIIPWISIGTLYHPAQGWFATYDSTRGVHGMEPAEYYTGTVLGAPSDVNVSDSSLNLGTNHTQTINSYKTGAWGNTDIGPGSTLTVSSGAILFGGGGPGSNGSIGNGTPANAGTLNFGASEGIIWGDWATAGPNTIGSLITGSGGLTKAGTNVLILKAANTYTGKTTVGAGTMQIGDGTLTTSRLGVGNVEVTTGSVLVIKSNVANGISDSASVALDNAGDVWYGTMTLESGINETVGGLWLGGVCQPAGTYGSSASSATYKNDLYFSGAGILTSLGGTTPVPEPASIGLLGAAGLLLGRRRR